MDHNVELMRDLMLALEDRQVSPRATVIVALDELSADLGRVPEDVGEGLDQLLALGYIDGPGCDEPGFWFFRKLTRKGIKFVDAARDPRDWHEMKRRFALKKPEAIA